MSFPFKHLHTVFEKMPWFDATVKSTKLLARGNSKTRLCMAMLVSFKSDLECASYGNTVTSLFKKNLVGLFFRPKLFKPVSSQGLEIELDSGNITQLV